MTLTQHTAVTFTVTACLIVVAGVFAESSSAAVAELQPDPSVQGQGCKRSLPEGCPHVMIAVTADPGERNTLTLVRDGADVVIADADAPLRAGSGCAATIGGGIRCARPDGPFEFGARVTVNAGDGDDRIVAPDLVFGIGDRFTGGPGNDTITAPGAVTGGPGNDALTGVGLGASVDGSEGDDVLKTIDTPLRLPLLGASNDVLLIGGLGNDEIRGGRGYQHIIAGPGRDTVRAGSGQSWIYGGPGDDDLSGGDTTAYIKGEGGDDRIVGSAWKDRLRGGPGADRISARSGADDLRGDAGADRIRVFDGLRDAVSCGPGADVVVGDRMDVRTGCERFHRGNGHRAAPPDALDE